MDNDHCTQILGLTPSASKDEIEEAYHVLALQHHPDMHNGDDAMFCQLQAAYAAALRGTHASHAPVRRTVQPGEREHKMLTLKKSDGSTQCEHIWIHGARDGSCNILTSPATKPPE